MISAHDHSKFVTLGSLHLASGVRDLNTVEPPGVHDLLRASTRLEDLVDYLATLSRHDQAISIDASLTNLHEVSHYHQSLSTITGTEIVHRTIWLAERRATLVQAMLQRDEALAKSTEDEIQDHGYLLDLIAEGAVCIVCRSDFYDQNRRLIVGDGIDKLPLEALAYEGLWVSYYRDEKSNKWQSVGGIELMEAESYAIESTQRHLIFSQYGDRISVYEPSPYPSRYTFVADLVFELLGFEDSHEQLLFSQLVRAIPRLALNVAPFRENEVSLRLPGLKLFRIFQCLREFMPFSSGIDDIVERLERRLNQKFGYPTSTDCVAHLQSEAEKQGHAARTIFDVNLRDHHEQVQSVDINLSSVIQSGAYGLLWTTLPKPPLTFSYTDSLIPRKVMVARDPSRGAKALALYLTDQLSQEWLRSRSFTCVIKAKGIFCPLKDQTCGLVNEQQLSKLHRNCVFELTVMSIVSGDPPSQVYMQHFMELVTTDPD